MQEYLRILRKLQADGVSKLSNARGLRTNNIDTISLFCETFRHNMRDGFPLLTTKEIKFDVVLEELFWFLSGEEKCTSRVWKPWMDKFGEVPSPYGVRWRNYPDFATGDVDQIKYVIDLLKKDPSSRRGVVVAWDPLTDHDSALPPCHYTFVVQIGGDGAVNLHVTMRSTDVPVGLPFNIASYAVLLSLFGLWLSRPLGELAITMVDCHIYGNQLDGVAEQMTREPGFLPELWITGDVSLERFTKKQVGLDQFFLLGYNPAPFIKFPVAL